MCVNFNDSASLDAEVLQRSNLLFWDLDLLLIHGEERLDESGGLQGSDTVHECRKLVILSIVVAIVIEGDR